LGYWAQKCDSSRHDNDTFKAGWSAELLNEFNNPHQSGELAVAGSNPAAPNISVEKKPRALE
jgi:hypothetical protein